MKRIIKVRGRPAIPKKGLIPKRRFLKGIKKAKRDYAQINAPHNTSEYLMRNNSSPFYEDEDDDDMSLCCFPNSLKIRDDSEDILNDDTLSMKKLASISTQGETAVKIESTIVKQTTSIFL